MFLDAGFQIQGTSVSGLPWQCSVKNPPANAGDVRDVGLIPGCGRSLGEGHGYPLQYSCLENLRGQKSLAGHSAQGCKESDMTGKPNNDNNNRRLQRISIYNTTVGLKAVIDYESIQGQSHHHLNTNSKYINYELIPGELIN